MRESDLTAYLEDLSSLLRWRFDSARRARVIEEARAHIEDGCACGMARGLSRDDAMREALVAFGGAAEVARRFSVELPASLFSKHRFRFLCLAFAAQAASLLAMPIVLHVAPRSVAKCLISSTFACVGVFFLADVIRLGRASMRRPLAWAVLPYLAVAVPFAIGNVAHRSSEKMSFDILGLQATVIHGIMEALFMFLAATAVFEIVQTRRLSRAGSR